MIFLATLKIAARALRRNTLRTLLTMLGIIFGVAAVIAMVSLGNGARAQLEASIATLGQNVITVMSGMASRGGFRMGFGSSGTLTLEDFEAIRREIPGVNYASPEVRNFAQLAAGNQNINSQIMGVGADYLEVRSWPCAAGEKFSETDVRNANKVALIGRTTAEILFGEEDPIGQIVRVRGAPFRIVGVLSPKGTDLWGRDQDDVLLVPRHSLVHPAETRVESRVTRSMPSGAAMIAITRTEVAPAFFTRSMAAAVELPVASIGSSRITSRSATSAGSFE